MRLYRSRFLIVILLVMCMIVPGVYATWTFYDLPEPAYESMLVGLKNFSYGPFYITNIEQVGGDYSSASTIKIAETKVESNVTLSNSTSSTVVYNITFYNSTDISYYYKDTQDLSWNNNRITYEVSDIEQKEEVPGKSYTSLTLTYKYENGVPTNKTLLAQLQFNFVVDKDSIGVIVAQTAVNRFEQILNNKIADNSYETLENTMNNRGNNSSVVTYIGNVSGATDADSKFIEEIFTSEFLKMDLDGDGKSEPITIMIKRENLDGDETTGDDYTYMERSFWGNGTYKTVKGAEFTIYITSEGFSSNTLNVYAATFTKLSGANEWVEAVPLTKGTAKANNYNGWGSNNSFNTDTWQSTDKKTMDTLATEAIKKLKQA